MKTDKWWEEEDLQPYETVLATEIRAHCIYCDHESHMIVPKRANITTIACPYCFRTGLETVW